MTLPYRNFKNLILSFRKISATVRLRIKHIITRIFFILKIFFRARNDEEKRYLVDDSVIHHRKKLASRLICYEILFLHGKSVFDNNKSSSCLS
jgi:hypothetical protein